MRYVYINKDGYLASPKHLDCDIEIEVADDELYQELCLQPIGKEWRYINNKFILEENYTNEDIQVLRQLNCFNIVDNRSQMWYNRLTTEQKQELDTWYQAWLDAPETKIIPETPEWLK